MVIGIGAFFCALGALHFTAVYLAASFYLTMPFGLAVSPGSLVLYAGTMCLLLLTYIREGAFVARQPIIGLLIGTFLLLIMISLLGFDHVRLPAGRQADITFLGQLGALMLWGTLLLFIETLFVFRLFERLMLWSGGNLWLSIWGTLVVCTTFDQLFFFPAIHLGFGIPWAAGLGGWIGKLMATAFYAALLTLFLRRVEGVPVRAARTAGIAPSGGMRFDPATGAFHPSRFNILAQNLLSVSTTTGRPLSLMLVDVELAPDEGGRAPNAGDLSQIDQGGDLMRQIAQAMSDCLRAGDYVVRHDGSMFAILAPGLSHNAAVQVASVLRQRVDALSSLPPDCVLPGLNIGVVTAPIDGETLPALLSLADHRVYAAKELGRNRVVGAFEA